MAAADRRSPPLPASSNDFDTRQMARALLRPHIMPLSLLQKKIFRRLLLGCVSFENIDASTFYVTTMGENQAPARQLFTECRAHIFLGWRLPTEGCTGIFATGVDEMTKCGCVLGSWASGVNELTGWILAWESRTPPNFTLLLRGSYK